MTSGKYFRCGFMVLILLLMPVQTIAVSAVATINVTIVRFLSITSTSSLDFGAVSVSSTAGSVEIDANGMRFASGGVRINPAGLYTPAKFIIEGKPDASFTITLPDKVELRDGRGNTLEVEGFKTSHQAGTLDANGALEINIGGKIKFEANQKSGDYSGTMIIELNYS